MIVKKLTQQSFFPFETEFVGIKSFFVLGREGSREMGVANDGIVAELGEVGVDGLFVEITVEVD